MAYRLTYDRISIHRVAPHSGCILRLCSLMAFCSGCTIGKVCREHDPFKNETTEYVRIAWGRFATTLTPSTMWDMRWVRVIPENKEDLFFVLVNTSTWERTLWPNELIWLADDTRIVMKGSSSVEDVQAYRNGVSYLERCVFVTSPSELLRISNASVVRFRFYGRGGRSSSFGLDDSAKKAARSFCDMCIPGSPHRTS